jgi:protein-L-isoaspartate(D-aspartate) O-methyltransferase
MAKILQCLVLMAQTQKRAAQWNFSCSPESLVLDIMDKGVRDERVLEAFTHVRREIFVPPELIDQAYEDQPIPLSHDQVTTQPSLIAQMVQALSLTRREKVLEIGTGFGFQTAILAFLCHEVFSIERFPDLARIAESNLRKAGFQNVKIHVGDGTLGLPADSPFDAIIVSAAAPQVPNPLILQLTDGGRLVQPIGRGGNEIVTSFKKVGGGLVKLEEITAARFVPLVGAFGI